MVVLAAVAACSGGGDDRAPEAEDLPNVEVQVEPGALGRGQLNALHAVATRQPRGDAAVEPSAGADEPFGAHGGEHSHGQAATGATSEEPTGELKAQLTLARIAAIALMGEPKLSTAGYYVGSYYSPGVGTHYIDWDLVGEAFDVAQPAMVLVDTTPGHPRRLAGFSYWVRSKEPPEGFTGATDVWHRHHGLCFVGGVLTKEGVTDPSACPGDLIDGRDLWMLHAWVVPGYENPDGVFAPTNRKLCPPRRGIDAGWCQLPGSSP
jgi:hypothetical protein